MQDLCAPADDAEIFKKRVRDPAGEVIYYDLVGGTVHIQDRGHFFAALAFADNLSSVGNLVRREFRFPAELHTPALALHSGARRSEIKPRSSSAGAPIIRRMKTTRASAPSPEGK